MNKSIGILDLNRIYIRNFMSVGDEGVELDFSKKNILTFIFGHNGAGKTTILEAISFVIFNKAYRKIPKANLVNSHVNKNTEIEIDFHDSGRHFVIKRTIKPDSLSIIVDGNSLNSYDNLAEGGDSLNKESPVRLQKRLMNILSVNDNIFRRTISLGTSGYIPFMFLSKGEKTKFGDNVMELDILTQMDSLNKANIKDIEAKIKDNMTEISILEQRITEMRTSDENVMRMHNEMLESAKNRMNMYKDAYESKKLEYEKSLEKFSLIIEPSSTKKEPKPYLDHTNLKNKCKEEVDKLTSKRKDVEKQVNDLEFKKRTLSQDGKRKVDEYTRVLHSDTCPTCNQKLDNQEAVANKVKELEEEIGEIKAELDSLPNPEPLRGVINELVNKETELVKNLNESIMASNKSIDTENIEIIEYNSGIEKRIMEYEHEKILVDRNMRDLNNAETLFNTITEEYEGLKIKEIKTNKENISKNLEVQNSLLEETDNLNLDLQDLKVIERLLSREGIRSDMINRYIPMFNRYVQENLRVMEAEYIFTLDSEFNETILSMGREKFAYESFSGGERARIDLAILFAWRKVKQNITGKELSLLFLDEVFDSAMDDDGVKSIIRLLKSLEIPNVVVISHKAHNKDNFDRVIEVKKHGLYSEYNVTEN